MMDSHSNQQPIQFQRGHGSLWDRGRADSWYMRSPRPHYIQNNAEITDLTEEERMEYLGGYNENEEWGEHKEWD